MRSSGPLIELQHCSLILDGHTVLDDVSFALRRGERWALVGPNGSGKTFLLKMLRGDVWPTPTGRERREAPAKEAIAYIGPERQDKYVRYDWNPTVAQVVTTGLFDEDIPLTPPNRAQQARVTRVLKRFGLVRLRRRRMLSLSYGQRRLVLIARAFVSDARVLLLDEVFNGLDVRARRALTRALERPRGGHDWVLTSHRPRELPKSVTHLAEIRAGRIVATGPRARNRPTGPLVNRPENKRLSSGQLASGPVGQLAAGQALVVIRNANVYRDYRPVLRDLNWTLARGEHWAILGANGSGKSTLLMMIHGDLHPALGGTIERDGVPFGTRIEEWKRRVGWVSPELQADHYLAKSLEEIVVSGARASVGLDSSPTRAERTAAARWLTFFGIEALRDRGPRQVSYGQMRLALIARAMMNDPELLLLDEPCTGLDGDMRAQVLATLESLARNGTQLVMAVHDIEDVPAVVRHLLRIGRGGVVRREAVSG